MSTFYANLVQRTVRLAAILSFVALTAVVSLSLLLDSSPAAAQEPPPPKKSKLDQEEEPPPKKQASAPKQAETSESTPPKKSKLDEEEEVPPKKPPASDSSSPPKSNIGSKATEVEEVPKNNTGRRSLDQPGSEAGAEREEDEEPVCDIVYLNDRAIKVKLLPVIMPFPIPPDQRKDLFKFSLLVSMETKKTSAKREVRGSEITHRTSYYEERMLKRAADLLGLTPEKLSAKGATVDLSDETRLAQAAAAEKLLKTALSEHDSAVQQNLRKGIQWERFRSPLVQSIWNLKLSRVDQLLAAGEHRQATTACEQLAQEAKQTRRDPGELRQRYERLFLPRAQQAAQDAKYDEARDLLSDWARRTYPSEISEEGRTFRDALIAKAGSLSKQAETLKASQPRRAEALIEEAAKIWPELPNLEAQRRQLEKDYPVLKCAYPGLPVNLSPLSARSPVERHAVALLFEGLVRWREDELAGAHYESQLALGRPVPLARGRQFQLQECRWSDWSQEQPHLCTVEDVRLTVKLLQNSALPGHVPAWAGLVQETVSAASNDPFVTALTLRRDHWQPLSLMDFAIVPHHKFPKGGIQHEIDDFNVNPVGTGPYVLHSRDAKAAEVRFTANPHYRTPGLPKIREISFHSLDPAVAVEQFLQNEIQLVYDLQPELVNQLVTQGNRVDTLRSKRSVWFLCPNYRRSNRKTQLDNENLRLAIAHAIDRGTILKEFRKGGATDHAELNGPYPRGSWAYNSAAPSFETDRAKAFLENAKKDFGPMSIGSFELAYPDNHPATEVACQKICDQVKAAIGIELVPRKISQQTFFSNIVQHQNFDLVYWRHDYEDESFWLWPLFDPAGQGAGGANFMSYDPDPVLFSLFQDMALHKKFPEIQRLTHAVHDHVARTAVVIPLWQLDTYVAVGNSLRDITLDPVTLFDNVQTWSLKSRAQR